MDPSDFEWDENKNQENVRKHGVSFHEAQHIFSDLRRIIAEDLSHSSTEKRYYCFGRITGGILTVRFTFRAGKVRIFGAGFWRKGKIIYESQNKIHR